VNAFNLIGESRARVAAIRPLLYVFRATGVIAALLVPIAASPADSQAATNALWNGTDSDGRVGFWLYPVSGECPGLRLKARPLVFALRRRSGTEFAVSDLEYCFQLPERASSPLVQCRTGGGQLFFDAETRRYSGRYSFQMTDGTRREGAFVAQYCPKSATIFGL